MISNINLKKKIADYTNLNQNTFNVIKLKKYLGLVIIK